MTDPDRANEYPSSEIATAVAALQSGDLNKADISSQSILTRDPSNVTALNVLGLVSRARGDLDRARRLFSAAVDKAPFNHWSLVNLGASLAALGRIEDAITELEKAKAVQTDLITCMELGSAYHTTKKFNEALENFELAAKISPKTAEAHNRCGMALRELGHFDEAIRKFDESLRLRPQSAPTLYNRASTLVLLSRHREAVAVLDEALKVNPNFEQGKFLKGTTLLALGEYEAAWPLYESRWKGSAESPSQLEVSAPRWAGKEPLVGKRILVHAEQGLGDQIQMSRFIPLLQAAGAEVVLQTPLALVDLFRSIPNLSSVCTSVSELKNFNLDLHCPIMSLPAAFQISLASIPHSGPYLSTPPANLARWGRILGSQRKPRVAIAWRAGAKSNIFGRSIELQTFSKIFEHRDIEWLSLHKDLPDEDLSLIQELKALRHFEGMHDNFCDAAAICDLADLVISVDTSLAHLAGALGRPTWVLLPLHTDWRWLIGRTDSPWYPTMRLFRQSYQGDWGSVLESIDAHLSERFA